MDGAALKKHYSESNEKLALKPGMLGVIFKGQFLLQPRLVNTFCLFCERHGWVLLGCVLISRPNLIY